MATYYVGLRFFASFNGVEKLLLPPPHSPLVLACPWDRRRLGRRIHPLPLLLSSASPQILVTKAGVRR